MYSSISSNRCTSSQMPDASDSFVKLPYVFKKSTRSSRSCSSPRSVGYFKISSNTSQRYRMTSGFAESCDKIRRIRFRSASICDNPWQIVSNERSCTVSSGNCRYSGSTSAGCNRLNLSMIKPPRTITIQPAAYCSAQWKQAPCLVCIKYFLTF